MYIADELLKLLVCEKCFENFHEKTRIPLCLHPCGHTFCEPCVKSVRDNLCPSCDVKFETIAKNWYVINLLPKPHIPNQYYEIKKQIDNSNKMIDELSKQSKQKKEDNTDLIEKIKIQINNKAEELINKIRALQSFHINRLDELKKTSNETFEKNSTVLIESKEANARLVKQIEDEDIKHSEDRLNEIKMNYETSTRSSENKFITIKVYLNNNKTIEYKPSKFFINEEDDEKYILGQLNVFLGMKQQTSVSSTSQQESDSSLYSQIEQRVRRTTYRITKRQYRGIIYIR
jgi:BMFP domain-containing protein YqiC